MPDVTKMDQLLETFGRQLVSLLSGCHHGDGVGSRKRQFALSIRMSVFNVCV